MITVFFLLIVNKEERDETECQHHQKLQQRLDSLVFLTLSSSDHVLLA